MFQKLKHLKIGMVNTKIVIIESDYMLANARCSKLKSNAIQCNPSDLKVQVTEKTQRVVRTCGLISALSRAIQLRVATRAVSQMIRTVQNFCCCSSGPGSSSSPWPWTIRIFGFRWLSVLLYRIDLIKPLAQCRY